jgi:hypothetical protein
MLHRKKRGKKEKKKKKKNGVKELLRDVVRGMPGLGLSLSGLQSCLKSRNVSVTNELPSRRMFGGVTSRI